jgi:murein DD-endopeptidase MepM/ murein hydrolase activator NlpD
MRRNVMELKIKSDSLERVLRSNNMYLQNVIRVINGEIPAATIDDSTAAAVSNATYDSIKLEQVSSSEKQLRKDVEQEERFTVNAKGTSTGRSAIRVFHFFTPLKGYITEPFNQSEQHYGVDIVAPENEPIKAALDGIVIFSGWTARKQVFVMAIQHNNNLISLYKHNSVLLKEEGNYVKAGDVIAINWKYRRTHQWPSSSFELWFNGLPLNPEDYIVFN